MSIFDEARQTVADMPKIYERITFRGVAFRLIRIAGLALLYFVALKGAFSWSGLHPLVAAWIVFALIYFSFFLWTEASEVESPKIFGFVSAAFAIAILLVFFVVNDPLWVKRVVSIGAVLQLFIFLVSLLFLKGIRARRPNWDAKLFMKGQAFQGPTAFVTLLINEIAIWTGDDWLWIASRAFAVLLIPFLFVLVARIITRQQPEG